MEQDTRTPHPSLSGTRLAAGAWRPRSVPEQLALLGLACTGAAFVYPGVSTATGLWLPCPLRELTGVPCPLCGMTTAATALAGGDLPGALTANPFVLLLAACTAVMLVVIVGRLAGRLPTARPMSLRGVLIVQVVVVTLAILSWLFQLARYGWIPAFWG